MTPETPTTTESEEVKPAIDPVDDFADVELGPPAQSCEIGCESCQ